MDPASLGTSRLKPRSWGRPTMAAQQNVAAGETLAAHPLAFAAEHRYVGQAWDGLRTISSG